MKVVILAGGSGTRAYPYTEYLPKPMMPVGGKPVLLRVMEIYARQGITDFVISVGYRKEVIIDYFENRTLGWNVEIVDTGAATDTGGRIFNCRHSWARPSWRPMPTDCRMCRWMNCWPSTAGPAR